MILRAIEMKIREADSKILVSLSREKLFNFERLFDFPITCNYKLLLYFKNNKISIVHLKILNNNLTNMNKNSFIDYLKFTEFESTRFAFGCEHIEQLSHLMISCKLVFQFVFSKINSDFTDWMECWTHTFNIQDEFQDDLIMFYDFPLKIDLIFKELKLHNQYKTVSNPVINFNQPLF